MRVLFIHPSPLMYSEIYLRLEPLGLERVAAAALQANHDVRILDLQIFGHHDFARELLEFAPEVIAFSLNYLANVPEVIDLAKRTKALQRNCSVVVGGHSASFIADELLKHGQGAIDCVVRGEGEAIMPRVLEAIGDRQLHRLPGVVTPDGHGPAPVMLEHLDGCTPARYLARRRKRYFIGVLDPCASIEFTRGCPWDCSFCSAWTFYGRSYRKSSAAAIAEDLVSINEPNVFIVDDVAFIHPEHGLEIGHEIEKRRIRKQYYLETRADVLCRNPDVFLYWRRLGLEYMFLGLEAIDQEGLKMHRKRSSLAINSKALEIAREIGLRTAINLIAEPDWDESRFEIVREWALSVPEMVHLTVATPYPGTETWFTESRKLTTLDYRLFDIQHAVLPTKLPLQRFYEELVKTQDVINRKYLGWRGLRDASKIATRLLLHGQTNFIRMLWNFKNVYDPQRLYSDHFRDVKYTTGPRPEHKPKVAELYVHPPAIARADSAAHDHT